MGRFPFFLLCFVTVISCFPMSLYADDQAVTLNRMAELYRVVGEYDKAESMYKLVLSIEEKIYGPEHARVAATLNNLALVYDSLGDADRAEPLYRRSLTIREKVYGPDHPDVAVTLKHMGGLYDSLGEYARAMTFYHRALGIDEKLYGSEHMDVAMDLGNLASVYHALGEYARAESLYKRTLAMEKKIRGSEDSFVAATISNLAGLYHIIGEYARAKPYYHRALEIKERIYGSGHNRVGIILYNLGELNFQLGKYDQAGFLYRRALTIAGINDMPELRWRVQDGLSYLLGHQEYPDVAIFFGKYAVNTIQELGDNISPMEKMLQRHSLTNQENVYKTLEGLLTEQERFSEAREMALMLGNREDAGKTDARPVKCSFNATEQAYADRYVKISAKLTAIGKQLSEIQEKRKNEMTRAEQARLNENLTDIRKIFNEYLIELTTNKLQTPNPK
ncbi:tetratricopeptide repeat protein [Desulfococcaceae bacterium HSG8]|nr:tetratricopeptide repeat protein [Desulfococcaceae bacterium HSG8]